MGLIDTLSTYPPDFSTYSPHGFKDFQAFYVMPGVFFVAIQLLMLVFLEFFPEYTSDFTARKLVHTVSGFFIIFLDPNDAISRYSVFAIAVSSILMTWGFTRPIGIQPFRFGKERDIGMTIYLILVFFWFFFRLPPAALSPLFFADPAGAVVGKNVESSKLYGPKSVAGSSAVFVFIFATLLIFYPPMSMIKIITLSLTGTIAELLGGDYDNFFIAIVVIGGYVVL